MKRVFLIRRIVGASMLPSLPQGRLVFGWGFGSLRKGDMVILSHEGIEKIKRINRVEGEKLYILGDNAAESTDSRHFGWVDRAQVLGRVIWPRLTQDLSS